MKVSDYISEFIKGKEIEFIFGYPGGMITHLIDSIGNQRGLKFIQTYNEQTAAFAAEGYAVESGNVGIAIATSGPGATNMITGIADAFFASIPVIFITGQVNTYEYKYDKPIRQQGFQETDIVNIVKSITKYAKLLDDPSQIKQELEKAYYIATSGRKGPALLDIPMNISRADISPNDQIGFTFEPYTYSKINLDEIESALTHSHKPLLLIGGGAKNDIDLIKEYSHKYNIPVAVSMIGKGGYDESDPLFIGMIGTYGNRCANIILSQCDLLIALGTRLDTRQTGAKIESFLPNSKIIHVNIDDNELKSHRLNNRIQVNNTVAKYLNETKDVPINVNNKWIEWVRRVKNSYNQDEEIDKRIKNKAPYRFLQAINEILKPSDIIVCDIGQNQIWASQTLRLSEHQKFITNAGLASMGSAIPLAVGMAFANPDARIICLVGDGGFQMSLQALKLISQYDLNIHVYLLNNKALGMITQFQTQFFSGRLIGTVEQSGYVMPKISSIAEAFSLPYIHQTSQIDISKELIERQIDNKKNFIYNFELEGLTEALPKVDYNKPIYNPKPYMGEDELYEILP